MVPTVLSAIAWLRSPVSQPLPSVAVPSATVTHAQAHIWGYCRPPQLGQMLPRDQTHPLTGTRPSFKLRFRPSFYFAPAQLLSQLPRGAGAGVSLSPWDGIAGCCCSARSLVFPKQSPKWGGTGPAGDARHEPGIRNPSPAFLGCQTSSKPAAPWLGQGPGSSAKPFGSPWPQQLRGRAGVVFQGSAGEADGPK